MKQIKHQDILVWVKRVNTAVARTFEVKISS